MLYRLSDSQLKKLSSMFFLPDFQDAEMLFATFETDPAVIKEILPSPLQPSKDNTATVFVAKYPKTNFGCVYNEGALLLNCEYKGEKGAYCLSMPVDDDMALIGGREQYGYPKKIADSITLDKNENTVIGSVVRKGKEIIRIECQITGDAPEDFWGEQGYHTKDWDGIQCQKFISFLFKYFPDPSGNGFDYLPRLIRQPTLSRRKEILKVGSGTVSLDSTDADPLGAIPVRKVMGMTYGVFHNTMLPGKVVARTWNIFKFLKYGFFKNDSILALLEQYDSDKIERGKEIREIVKKY